MTGKLFLFLTALRVSVYAAPAATIDELAVRSSAEIQERTVGGVYICTDINWGGTCGYKVQPLNKCIHLDSPWFHSISSFRPDPGTYCKWFYDYNCQKYCAANVVNTSKCYWFARNPGYNNLINVNDGIGHSWNDKIGSFMCWAE